jgi:hypothetical protein
MPSASYFVLPTSPDHETCPLDGKTGFVGQAVVVLDSFGITQRVFPLPDAIQVRIKPLKQPRQHRCFTLSAASWRRSSDEM